MHDAMTIVCTNGATICSSNPSPSPKPNPSANPSPTQVLQLAASDFLYHGFPEHEEHASP